jgi:hypothetical protein
MATLPSPEKTAREILNIFTFHFNCRPDQILRINNFLAIWHERQLDSTDFKPGMEFAAKNGWVEVQPNGDSFKLTSTGFAEAK